MSYAGSVLAMLQSLRANARPKHKAYQDWDSHEKLKFSPNQKLSFKKVSEKKLSEIKKQNSTIIEREQNRSMIIKIVAILILVPLFALAGFQFFFSVSNSNYRPYGASRVQPDEIPNTEQINLLLNSGYEWLSNNHYKNARFQFERVLETNPGNKTANFGYVASFVYECELSNTNCEKAVELLQLYLSKFGSDSSTELLIEMLGR